MSSFPDIAFFDLEVHPKSGLILEYGYRFQGTQQRGKNIHQLKIMLSGAPTLCGHNIIDHDLPKLYDGKESRAGQLTIDTLYLSALLFPNKPYHRLVKDYHLVGTELNNPLSDALLAEELLADLVKAFQELPVSLQTIYSQLLYNKKGFDGFFKLVNQVPRTDEPIELIPLLQKSYGNQYCHLAPLRKMIEAVPIELAYSLALITTKDVHSLPPAWLLHRFPKVLKVVNTLRATCKARGQCPYCPRIDPKGGLKRFFGFDDFRSFEGDTGKPLQQRVVEAALDHESLLAIFPTGGGKSLAFQLPALMKGEANRSLTVIISPLQSLMKDQVDVLLQRHSITAAVTINGMLSPLERSEAIERVREGGANLLYIAPESLRSHTILHLLTSRHINRFVIDEAHCFSSWGQDFRVDYLYIGPFLKKLQELKGPDQTIPVSCFTATAKPAVIEDICTYFKEHLDIELQVFKTDAKRTNLSYFVIPVKGDEEKMDRLRELLQSEEGARIVYVSRVKTSEKLAQALRAEGFAAKAYNGQLERDVKIAIQNEFMDGELEVIVATSAFGMGVDKENVKMVVHYTISDSLENYMQESGRAGRSPELQAKCFVLFDENDLNKHFTLLNTTKLSHKEIYQIWQGIKLFRKKTFTKSALEIAKKAGWDTNMLQLETRVKVAIAALEETGYVTREQNSPKIFASSILVKNVEEAYQRIDQHHFHFNDDNDMNTAKRIFGSLISRLKTNDEMRVDIMAEALGLEQPVIANILNIFRQIGLLHDTKDLTAYYYTVNGHRHSEQVFKRISTVEEMLFDFLFAHKNTWEKTFFIKEFNEKAYEADIRCDPALIRDILNYWSIINLIQKERIDRTHDQYRVRRKKSIDHVKAYLKYRNKAAAFCLHLFQQVYLPKALPDDDFKDKTLLRFSVLELKKQIEAYTGEEHAIRFYEYLLLFMHHTRVIELKSGMLIYYNPMRIIRHQNNNRKKYTLEDYTSLAQYYQSKTEQIHIVGEYAKKQLAYTEEATQFVEDYFTLDYGLFLDKYFQRRKGKIKRPITEEKFRQIMEQLSPEQVNVIKDNKHDNILVAAGPGSGKTRVLVHKVASLLLMEDVKPEQFLMLTFTRPAALEFKTRLKNLVGNIAYGIDIFTYHGFAFQLAGRMGDLEKSRQILPKVTEAVLCEDIPLDRLRNKSVIIVDEYQDVSKEEYEFMNAVIEVAEQIRVIVVGDDDQNIYEFRGANITYMRKFVAKNDAVVYYLTRNYRARKNLLAFTNHYLDTRFDQERIKHNIPLVAHKKEDGALEVTYYKSRHLIQPLVEDILSRSLEGTTAILTPTNEEAVLITSLLHLQDIPARLIADKPGFSLRHLLEIKSFTYYLLQRLPDDSGFIPDPNWEAAKTWGFTKYADSQNLDLLERVLFHFEKTYPRKFYSNWNSYLKEIRVEDFYHPDRDALLVSTMHKAKGKEFDQVFLLLDTFPMDTPEKRRVLYVAMTRAMQGLYIHSNSVSFTGYQIAGLRYRKDPRSFAAPSTLILQGSMKDVWLGYFKQKMIQRHIGQLASGAPLQVNEENASIFQHDGKHILKLSRVFEGRLTALMDKYTIHSISARYIVVWYDEESGESYRVVLPEVRLGKG